MPNFDESLLAEDGLNQDVVQIEGLRGDAPATSALGPNAPLHPDDDSGSIYTEDVLFSGDVAPVELDPGYLLSKEHEREEVGARVNPSKFIVRSSTTLVPDWNRDFLEKADLVGFPFGVGITTSLENLPDLLEHYARTGRPQHVNAVATLSRYNIVARMNAAQAAYVLSWPLRLYSDNGPGIRFIAA